MTPTQSDLDKGKEILNDFYGITNPKYEYSDFMRKLIKAIASALAEERKSALEKAGKLVGVARNAHDELVNRWNHGTRDFHIKEAIKELKIALIAFDALQDQQEKEK